jgi:hypothetical protein
LRGEAGNAVETGGGAKGKIMTRIIRRGVAKLLLSRFVVPRSKLAAVDHPAAAFLVFPRWMPSLLHS